MIFSIANQSFKSLFFFFLQKCNFLTFFRLEFKKKWAGIKYFGLELIFLVKISVFKSFINIFLAGIKKKWAGIKYFGLELIFLMKIGVFKSFFNIFSAGIKKSGLE